ncbi:MAG: acetate--CoA ligase family protein [Proteobacteria bacterium]|nr:acetate--CoA ligase family protein [Pseudomonadota bacterium]
MTIYEQKAVSQERSQRIHQCLFRPRSIAVIGASSDPLKPGGRVLKNILEHGYAGILRPVNPKATEILGLPVCSSIAALPEIPDLAIVAIPSAMVPAAVAELADRGTGATIVLTSGFGEKDAAGKEVEEKMRRIADAAGMALIGPNCSGFLTAAYKGKFAGIVPKLPGGAVDFISGSGATVDYVMECAVGRGLSFGTVINLGNSVQMGVEDLVQLHDQNYGSDCARILLLYMEAVKKPQLLLRHASSLSKKGCLLVGIKSGTTAAGSRAAASHTGAMATSDTAVQALFEKAGIIRVTSREALIDVACVLQAAKGRLKGNRFAIVTDAGGPGVMLADELTRGGLELPPLSEGTRSQLAKILLPESSTANPIDALPSRTAEQIAAIIRILGEFERGRLDAVAVLTGDSGLSDNAAIYRAIGEAMEKSPIPVLPVLSSLTSCREKIDVFTGGGKVFFPDEVALGRALGLIARQTLPAEELDVCRTNSPGYSKEDIGLALNGKHGALDPFTVRRILFAAGFKLPEELLVQEEQYLAENCRRLGFPLAMKVIGPLHKTDVGGVRLGIGSETEALAAWSALMVIPEARGVLLQPMIGGLEVILGASREGDFGHLLMFGLGGIHTEVLKDVRFALAPISEAEAGLLINGIRGRALLDGVRGAVGMDTAVLADFLIRLGRLVADFPEICEIDLNPVKGFGDRLLAIDARILVEN